MRRILTLAFSTITMISMAQNSSSDYYYQIPDYPDHYNAATVAARLLDGLGFRYYWASADLSEGDLQYKASEEGRTINQTLDHILGLSTVIVNTARQTPNGNAPEVERTYDEKRTLTLSYLREASEILKKFDENDLEQFPIVFERADRKSEFPFWNLINGPIADALWHVGQVVSMRRGAGNPLNSKVSVFTGQLRE